MNNYSIALVVLIAGIVLVQLLLIFTRGDKNPKWKRVYFYLMDVEHTLAHIDWREVHKVLVTRYKLDSIVASEAIENLHRGESWFIDNIIEDGN